MAHRKQVSADGDGLIGRWLIKGGVDASPAALRTRSHGVKMSAVGPHGEPNTAAAFDGRGQHIEVADHARLRLGAGDFTVAAWVCTSDTTDVVGDLLSKFDPETRTGLNLSVLTQAGVCGSQANYRQVVCGIDAGVDGKGWIDCGRPGAAVKIASMASFDGTLYAGTFEIGATQRGHVYRHAGGKRWIDCGSPDGSNCVFSLAEFRGELYAATGRYKAYGSALPDSPNRTPGGRVYRYAGGRKWVDCGRLVGPRRRDLKPPYVYAEPGPTAVAASYLAVCNNRLYAGATYNWGVYAFEGKNKWTYMGPDNRVMGLFPWRGALHALSNGSGDVMRFDGRAWSTAGTLPDSSQLYASAIHNGQLFVATWPNAMVFREDDDGMWRNTGRLGFNMEVMGMSVYNGKLYAGVLPMADVHRYDGDGRWAWTGNLDPVGAVLKRVWSMCVHDGRLYAGTLPSGRVMSYEAGATATHDRALAPGWRHIAAVRRGGTLTLHIDGKPAARSRRFDAARFDLSNHQPLRIGAGAHANFHGAMSDVRLYGRALEAKEVAALSAVKAESQAMQPTHASSK